MTMAAPEPRATGSTTLLLGVVGLAVVIGLVAVLVSGAAPPPPKPQAEELIVDLPPVAWALLYLSPFLIGFGVLIVRRLRDPSPGLPHGTVVVATVLLVFAVVLVYLFLSGIPGGSGYVSLAPTNSTGSGPSSPTPPTNNSTHHPCNPLNTSCSGTAAGSTSVIVPAWAVYAVIAGLSVCVGVVALPGVVSRLADRRRRSGGTVTVRRVEVQRAFLDAAAAIDRGEDPRETVVRLYLRLLAEIGPRAGDVRCLTADEIRAQVLAQLGVRPMAATELTRLFEEARYSTHPMGAPEAGRCRDVIGQVETDLLRGIGS